ncbi:hypothetical protein Q7P36_008827 [Cladosporium allicinum]
MVEELSTSLSNTNQTEQEALVCSTCGITQSWLIPAHPPRDQMPPKIKKLEEDNQALFVAIANVVASEQAANWENSRLVSNQTSYKTTLREYSEYWWYRKTGRAESKEGKETQDASEALNNAPSSIVMTSIKFPMTGIVLSGFTAEKAKDLCTFACHFWKSAWNVAMQNSDPELRSHMQEFMHRRYQNDETAARPAREHYLAAIDAMLAYSRSHGVSERRWARIVNNHAQEMLDDVDQLFNTVDMMEMLYPAGSEQHTGIERGRILTMALYRNVTIMSNLIRQPVGGVFNLNLEHGRRAAAGWLLKRTLANTADWSGPENYAIFACGPGGTTESRLLGAEIYTALYGRRGRTRMWMPHMRRGVTFGQRHSTQMVVHVSDQQFDMDDRQFHRLVVTTDRMRTPLREQDASLRSWLFSLFTNPEAILSRIREIYANTPGSWDRRPSTFYMLDAAVEETVSEENRRNGEETGSLSSEPSDFETQDQATSTWVAQLDDEFDTQDQATTDWVDQLDDEFSWSGAPYPNVQLPALNTQVADEHVETHDRANPKQLRQGFLLDNWDLELDGEIDRLSTSDPEEEPPILGVQFIDPEVGTLNEAHVEALIALRATRRQADTGDGEVLVHVTGPELDADARGHHHLIAVRDQSIPAHEQDLHLAAWLFGLFQNPFLYLGENNSTAENIVHRRRISALQQRTTLTTRLDPTLHHHRERHPQLTHLRSTAAYYPPHSPASIPAAPQRHNNDYTGPSVSLLLRFQRRSIERWEKMPFRERNSVSAAEQTSEKERSCLHYNASSTWKKTGQKDTKGKQQDKEKSVVGNPKHRPPSMPKIDKTLPIGREYLQGDRFVKSADVQL